MTLAEKMSKIKAQTQKINAEAGKIVAGFLSDDEIAERLTVKFVKTPNIDLNTALSGGWPIGRLTVITGKEDSGKQLLRVTYNY